MSQGHAYRLLNQGRIIRELEAVANSPVGEISERAVRDIKPHLIEVKAAISERIADGERPAEAVQATVADVRQRLEDTEYTESPFEQRASRCTKDQDNRYADNVVAMVSGDLDYLDSVCIDYTNLDPTFIKLWVKELRQSVRRINQFAKRLERAQK